MAEFRSVLRRIASRVSRLRGRMRVLLAPNVTAGARMRTGQGTQITVKFGQLQMGEGVFVGVGTIITARLLTDGAP